MRTQNEKRISFISCSEGVGREEQVPAPAGRAGFTLIELLVVIAIIAILASLLTGGIWAIMRKGPEMVVRNDITQLTAALQKFKTDYKVPSFPPDELKLCMNRTDYGNTPLDNQSVQFLSAMFPNMNFTNVHWAGPGVPAPAGGWILEGDQVLVFCLGGPPAGANAPALMGGWSKIPTDPIDAGYTKPDRSKNFEFNEGRLKLMPRTGNNAAAHFPSYIDGFNLGPYVYFGSGLRTNGYSGVANTLGVSAYLQTANPPTFQNPSSFQIIAPGRDGHFGLGGVVWPPSVTGTGADDMTNFTDVKLGNAP